MAYWNAKTEIRYFDMVDKGEELVIEAKGINVGYDRMSRIKKEENR